MRRESPTETFAAARFFVLRTPLLPWEEIEAWSRDLAVAHPLGTEAEEGALERSVDHDRQLLRRRLERWMERPEILEALFVASPSIVESLEVWRRDADSKKGARVERALVRYLTRMASRPTPFGLFSGCSVGKVQPEAPSRLRLADRGRYRRRTRLDMDYLFALSEDLGQSPELRRSLIYRPNSSLYEAAGRWRYAEARLEGGRRHYHLVAVGRSDYLDAALERARQGATLAELAAVVMAEDPEGEITAEEAEEFLFELVDSQLLVSDLAPPVTGAGALESMLEVLSGEAPARETVSRLAGVRDRLRGWDETGLGNLPAVYLEVARELDEHLPTRTNLSRLFQVDMVKPVHELTLGGRVLEEIRAGVEVLRRLAEPPGGDALSPFRQAFVERWGEGREVPLAEALDEEMGVGFGGAGGVLAEASPLLAGLPFRPRAREARGPWGSRQAFLLERLEDLWVRGEPVLELSPKDLEAIAPEVPASLPDAFAVMATIAGTSEEAVARGDLRLYLRSVGGPSGARLLGRFCHLDEKLEQGVREHLREEEALQPNAVFAEIVHLPEGRIGNILARPVLREHEIELLGRPSVGPEGRIRLSDLRVSVVGSRVILSSERLGQEVQPRLTTAHNVAFGGLGIYRFLCALQNQGQPGGLFWSWGALADASFLPRVTVGRLVLERARWRMRADEIEALAGESGAGLLRVARRWRESRRLPREILLADGDNELWVDLESILCLESFADLVKGRPSAQLVEVFPGPEDLWAESTEGRFVHEILVPFVRRKEEAATPRPLPPRGRWPDHPPGSSWLYLKVYTGAAGADDVLRRLVAPVAREAVERGAADRWFFLRFGDPGWHLRVRFHGEPERLRREVLPEVERRFSALLEEGAAWRLQLDTYQPETERYGGEEALPWAEELFWADSEAVVTILETLEGDAGHDARWRLALAGCHRLLEDLGFDLESRLRILGELREGFTREHGADLQLKRRIGDRYRSERQAIEELLGDRQRSSELLPGLEAFDRRSRASARAVGELGDLAARGLLTSPLEAVAPSLLHMHVNRLIRSEARAHELVLYEMLFRYYQSQRAR